MLAKHEATAVSHRQVSLSHQLCSLPAGGRNTELPFLAGATAGGRGKSGVSRCLPSPTCPHPHFNDPSRPGMGLDAPRGCSAVCRAPGMGCPGERCRSELTAGDVPVAGGEAVRGDQGAALALPQPPVAAVVGLAAPAGTPPGVKPRPANPPSPRLEGRGRSCLKFKASKKRRRQGNSGIWLGSGVEHPPPPALEGCQRETFRDPGLGAVTPFWVLTGRWDPRGSRSPRCRRNSRTSCRTAGRSCPWPP